MKWMLTQPPALCRADSSGFRALPAGAWSHGAHEGQEGSHTSPLGHSERRIFGRNVGHSPGGRRQRGRARRWRTHAAPPRRYCLFCLIVVVVVLPAGWNQSILSVEWPVRNKSASAPHIVRYLIERGADVSTEDSAGRTPLYYAVRNKHKCAPDIVRILIEKGRSHCISARLFGANKHAAKLLPAMLPSSFGFFDLIGRLIRVSGSGSIG